MPGKERKQISDAKELRALAHPLRWRLLELIGREGRATATQCAQEVGESVASCSYHLNTLAKYGYIEHAEGGQGREKPWRRVYRGHSWSRVGMDDEGALAAEAASGAFVDFAFTQIKERFRVANLEPDDWRDAIGADDTNVHLTAAEAAELRAEMRKIMLRFEDRRDDLSLRPEGARSVHFFLSTTVAPGNKPS